MPTVFQTTYRSFRKQRKGGSSLNQEAQGQSLWIGLCRFYKKEQLDVLKKDGKLLREAFLGSHVPGGQIESGLLVSRELETLRKIHGKKRNYSSKSR